MYRNLHLSFLILIFSWHLKTQSLSGEAVILWSKLTFEKQVAFTKKIDEFLSLSIFVF